MCNSTGYRKFVLELKDEILEKDSISKEEASEYIESLDHFNKELNEEDRLGLSNQIDLMKLYINLIVKIKNSNLEIKSELENQKKELESNKTFIEDYNKRILEMMGIFLSIFSVIGLGISSILNIENNHFAIWSMICGVILITMSGLFYLINFNEKIGEKF